MGHSKSFTHTWPNARRRISSGKFFRQDDRLTVAERLRRDSRWILVYVVALLGFGIVIGDLHFFGAFSVGAGIGSVMGWVSGPNLARTAAAAVTAVILIGGTILAFDLQDAIGSLEVFLMFAIVFAVVISQYMANRSAESATS